MFPETTACEYGPMAAGEELVVVWKEPVVGAERRMDIVVTYGKTQKEVVEPKIWSGEEYHRQGLRQLSEYLDFQNLTSGFLLIFDFRKDKTYRAEAIAFEDAIFCRLGVAPGVEAAKAPRSGQPNAVKLRGKPDWGGRTGTLAAGKYSMIRRVGQG